MILRIFRARAHPGRGTALEHVIRTRGIPNISGREGLVALLLGRPDESQGDELVLISLWRDLDALRAFKGESWREARLLPEELELTAAAAVSHIIVDTVAGRVDGLRGAG
jgi:heme-degrading monooxygenase HmoA